MIAGTSTISDSRSEWPKIFGFLPLRSCHADTASMTSVPVVTDARTTLPYPHRNTGLVNTATMLSSCGLPLTIL